MGRPQSLHVQSLQSFNGLTQAIFFGTDEVCAAQDRMDRTASDKMHMVEYVNDAGMGTAKYYDQPVWRIEEQGLVVYQWIGLRTGVIKKERAAGVLKVARARHLARNEQAFFDLAGAVRHKGYMRPVPA